MKFKIEILSSLKLYQAIHTLSLIYISVYEMFLEVTDYYSPSKSCNIKVKVAKIKSFFIRMVNIRDHRLG